jgi:hypothetical protein
VARIARQTGSILLQVAMLLFNNITAFLYRNEICEVPCKQLKAREMYPIIRP